MWGVQSVPMERPAHTALLQSIWNHPAEENSQNVNLGSCGGEGGLILRSAFATFGCSHNSCAGELPRSASSHFFIYVMPSIRIARNCMITPKLLHPCACIVKATIYKCTVAADLGPELLADLFIAICSSLASVLLCFASF